jgi:hypothetical protein
VKQQTRKCDLCETEETMKSDSFFTDKGWTELLYQFGTSANAHNAKLIRKDICPACALKLGMIRENTRNPNFVLRPENKDNVSKETQNTLEDHLREFIIQVGSDEGWYPEN